MKKRILMGISAFAVILLLMSFAIIRNQSQDTEVTPSHTLSDASQSVALPEDSCDALLLVEPKKQQKTDQYDLLLSSESETPSDSYSPLPIENTSFFCKKSLSPLIARSLTLGDTSLCHYALFEKNNTQFAVFHAQVFREKDAEILCHRLRCYLDYFPTLLFGEFDKKSIELITKACGLSAQNINGTTFFSANLTSIPHEKSGTLMLHFQQAPKTLDLNQKMIALSYDDGPDIYTERIVNTLEAHGAKATFFVNGTHVTDHPDLIQKIHSSGCEIGNHTNLHELFSHNSQGIIRKTIEETNKKIRKVVGIGAIVVRPPGGETVDKNNKPVTIGYPIIRWSLDTFDYTNGQTAETVLQSIKTQAKDGDIVLMHDTKSVTADAASAIYTYLQSQGFQLVTVSELLEFSTSGAVNDRIYNRAS